MGRERVGLIFVRQIMSRNEKCILSMRTAKWVSIAQNVCLLRRRTKSLSLSLLITV